jgi:superfamily I DNA/RNA helicase
VLGDYQRRFRYILVDEYQDTNVAQYLWLRLLGQSKTTAVIPGHREAMDPESITTNQDYGFRARRPMRVEDARARAYGLRPGMTTEFAVTAERQQ